MAHRGPLKPLSLAGLLALAATAARALPDPRFDSMQTSPSPKTDAEPETPLPPPATEVSGLHADKVAGAAPADAPETPAPMALLRPETIYTAAGNCRGEGTGTYSICLDIVSVTAPGHDHASSFPPVEFPNNDRCKSGIPLNQQVVWRFKTPLHSSTLKATWTWSGACGGSDSQTAGVGIEGLVSLGAGTGYQLVGQTPRHKDNHFAASPVIAAIPKIAADYKAAFPGAPDLWINDISLRYGGLFDIRNDWVTPHITHRFGYQVDMQQSSVPPAHREKLEQIVLSHGGRVLVEGTHYHLDFTPKNSVHYEEALRCDL